jgi:hypothetical protein
MALLKRLGDLIAQEPALVVGLVTAAIALAVGFGVPISLDQQARIVAFTGAILALVGALVVRSQVVPAVNVAPPAPAPPLAK